MIFDPDRVRAMVSPGPGPDFSRVDEAMVRQRRLFRAIYRKCRKAGHSPGKSREMVSAFYARLVGSAFSAAQRAVRSL